MNNISVLNARNFIREGGKFGFFTATSYELQGDRIVLIATCEKCSAKNRIPWTHVNVEARTPGSVLCVNRERHKAVATPAAPDWRSLSDDQFRAYIKSLSANAYLALAKDHEFAARDLATERKQIDRKEAITRKDSAESFAKREAQREIFVNCYYAYQSLGGVPPFNFEKWLTFDNATKQSFIQRFSLDTIDYKAQELGKLFGRSN